MNTVISFPQEECNFLITGPAGQLEMLTSPATSPTRSVAIICHPHPLHQGTMHNKVVHTLARAFQRQGYYTVRFNYRGVGKSAGKFADPQGEIADLLAVMEWVATAMPNSELSLAGFSFGAYIAANGATHCACRQLFSVAPAVTNQPFDTLPTITCPWTVLQGEEDEVIAPELVYAWFKSAAQRHPLMQLITFPATSHFFHGELIRLRTVVEENCLAKLV